MHHLSRFLVVLSFVAAPFVAKAGPSYDVYTEGWQSGWGSWSWNVSLVESTSAYFKATKSMRVTYNTVWAGFAPGAWQNLDTSGYKHLTFAFYNSQNGDDLWLVAQNSGGTTGNSLQIASYTETGTIPQGKWIWVRVPVVDFGLGSAPLLSNFSIQSGKSNAIVYFDEITFGASVPFYEGIQAEKGPGTMLWKWPSNLEVTQPSSGGDYWLQVSPSQAWSGIQLQQQATGIVSSEHGGVTVLFNKSSSSQAIYVSLVNENEIVVGTVLLGDSYLPSTLQPMQANKWYRAIIPLSHFFSGTVNLAGVVFETNTANAFSVDDVKLVQKLSWPIAGYARQISDPNGGDFGDYWINSCGGLAKLHSGSDYSDFADSGRSIYAASRGVVKQINDQSGGWGFAVIIQHEGGFTTSYLHLNSPSVSVGQEVQRGAFLGTTKFLSSGSHLHFGMRVKDYDSISERGGLPQTTCGDPAFPSYFLDSQRVDW